MSLVLSSNPSPIPASVSLKELADELSRCTFTDFDRAKLILAMMTDRLSPQSPFEIRLIYWRCGAFLENQWRHYEQALEHGNRAVAILESLADSAGLAEAWADISGIFQNKRDWNAAQESLDRARRYLNENAPARLCAQVDCREGFLHLHLGNTTNALDSLLKAEENLSDMGAEASLKEHYMFTLTLSGLGELYERVNEKEKSLDAYLRVLPVVERLGLRPRLAWHYLNAGRAAYALSNLEEAKACFEKVLEWAAEGDAEARTHALGNLGILAIWEGDRNRAWALIDQAAAQYANPAKPSDFTNLSKVEGWRAGLMTQTGDVKKARLLLEKAYTIGEKGEDLNHLSDVCKNLADVNRELDDYKQAYKWQALTTEYTVSHFKQLRNRDREDIEARHQLERSRQEAQMARLRVAGLQLRALRAQMNPHFMFNALNAIQGLITSGRNNEAESYLAKFARMMRQTLEYSDLEVVTLDEEIEFLERFLDINRKLRFRDRLNFKIIMPQGADTSDLYVPTMILQPFVENAIEHGLRPKQEGNLHIEFKLTGGEDELLLCTIEDDGVGYNKGREKHNEQSAFQKHRSRGMEITKERLTLLHQIQKRSATEFIRITDLSDVEGSVRTGTRVEVLLPMLAPED